MDYYPPEFSARARARVEAERLIRIRELESAQAEQPLADWKRSTHVWDQCEFYNYILRVFLAFAKEACELGKEGRWTLDRVRSEANEFLRRFTIEAYYERGRDRYGEKFPDMTSNWNGSLLPDVQRVFQRTDEWRQFEDEMLAAAQQTAGPKVTEEPPMAGHSSRTSTEGATPEKSAEREIEIPSNPKVLSGSLSPRDAQVHTIVGEQSFRTLTNTEIMKTHGVGRRLRDECELRTEDAAKSCLDRIRNARGYPLSRDISKKRSAQ